MIKCTLFEINGMTTFDTNQRNNTTGTVEAGCADKVTIHWNFHRLLSNVNWRQGGAAHSMATSCCCSDCGPSRTTCKSERKHIHFSGLLA